MASTDDGTTPEKAPRRARTAAEQRQERAATSNDPEVLAAEIERTREELAETLDAIADKVSPKRVASRTSRKVSDAVKEGATQLKDAVHDKKEQLTDRDGGDEPTLAEALEEVGADPGEPAAGETTAVPTAAAPGLRPVPPAPAPAARSTSLGPPAVAGGLAALLVALLVMRRRRRRRSRWQELFD